MGNPGKTYLTRSGNLYTAQSNGVIGYVLSGDVRDLVFSGCTFGIPARNVVTITEESELEYNCSAFDGTIYVNKTVGSPTLIVLFPTPNITFHLKVKDVKGDANINPITIFGSIDGASEFVIDWSNGSCLLEFNGSEWSVMYPTWPVRIGLGG